MLKTTDLIDISVYEVYSVDDVIDLDIPGVWYMFYRCTTMGASSTFS